MPVLDPIQWILLALWVFWVGVDQRAWGAFQVHQPLVAGTVTGIITGLPWVGVFLGVALQALWIRPLPVGGSILPASGLAACASVLWFRLVLGSVGERVGGEVLASWLVSAVVALAAAWFGFRIELWLRWLNARLESSGLRLLELSNKPMLKRTMMGLVLAGGAGWVTVGVSLLLGMTFWRILVGAPDAHASQGAPAIQRVFGFAWILFGVGFGGEITRLGQESWKGLGWVALGILLGVGLWRLSP